MFPEIALAKAGCSEPETTHICPDGPVPVVEHARVFEHGEEVMFLALTRFALRAALTTCWIFGASAQEARPTELKKTDLTGTNM